jgi:RHS repeat-associated protein
VINDQLALTETLSVASPLSAPSLTGVEQSPSPQGLETPVISDLPVATDYSADQNSSLFKTPLSQAGTRNTSSTKIGLKDTDPLTGLAKAETTVGTTAQESSDSLLNNSNLRAEIVIPPIGVPDLAVSGAAASLVGSGADQKIKVTWEVKNTGGIPLNNPPAWNDRVWLSSDPIFDLDFTDLRVVELQNTQSLAVGETYIRSAIIDVPSAATPYIIVTTNYPNARSEANNSYANNIFIISGLSEDPNGDPRNLIPGACGQPAKVPTSSETEQHSGALIETHDLVTYQSRGETRGLTLRYDSLEADPRQIVNFGYEDVFNQSNQLLIAKLNVNRGSFSTQAGGYQGNQFGLTGGENFWKIPTISGFGQVNAALQVNMRGAASGVYNYTLDRGIQTYDPNAPQFDSLLTQDQGTFTNINRIGSRFGNGWTLEELQEIVVNPNNSVLLIEGDGTSLIYTPNGSGGYTSQTSDYSTLVKLSNGTFQRTLKNGTVYSFNSSNQLASLRESNGDITQYLYNGLGRLTSRVDPAGLSTTFGHNTNGKVITITDPANRITNLTYDAAGNLTSITDPDGAKRTWEYDSQFKMTAEVDQRGNREESIYDDVGGRVRAARRKGSTIVRITPVQVQALSAANLTNNFTTAPTALALSDADAAEPLAVYTIDGQINRWQTRLNQGGYGVNFSDAVGFSGSVVMCSCGEVRSTTSASNNITNYTYDSRGNLTQLTDDIGTQTFAYESKFNQLIETTSADPDGTGPLLASKTLYGIDTANGNLLSMTQVVGAVGGTDDLVTRFTYDPTNQLIDTITDAAGRITDRNYDSQGRLIQLISAKGTADQTIETYAYDLAGNLTNWTDANGNITRYTYDARNRLTRVTEADPDGAGALTSPISSYAYDAMGNLLTFTNARGQVTRYSYDKMNRLLQVIEADPDGTAGPLTSPVTDYTYDANGNLATLINGRRQTTRYTYDARNRLVRSIDPDPDGTGAQSAPVTTYGYDLSNNLTSIIDPNGLHTSWSYDIRDRQVQLTEADPDGTGPLTSPITRYTYDPLNQLISTTNPNNQTTRYTYDQLNRLTQITQADPDGTGPLSAPVTRYTYDRVGNQTSVIDPLNRTTSYQYDNLNRLTLATSPDPDGAGAQVAPSTRYTYDKVGNLLTSQTALGATQRHSYDALNRQISSTDALNQTTRYTYDGNDNLRSVTDSVGNLTSYNFDGLDRLAQSNNALGFIRNYSYDANDNLTGIKDRNGRQRRFAYDGLDRQANETWLDSAGTTLRTFSYTYDTGSRLLTASDRLTGASTFISTYRYTYDNLNRVTGIDNTGTVGMPSVLFNYSYDANGNLTQTTDTISGTQRGTTSYSYDALNRVTRITQAGNGVLVKRVDMQYDTASQLTGLNRFSDTAGTQAVAQTSYSYDLTGRLTNLSHQRSSTNLATYGLSYDAESRLTRLTTPEGSSDYTYDSRGQLTATNHSYQTDEANTYDGNGNRTTTGYQTGSNNRLLSDGVFTYTYDNEGNRTRRTEIATGIVTDYTWDYRNRLTRVVTRSSATGPVTRQVDYVYDVNDNRTAKVVDLDGAGAGAATTERYAYDGEHIALVFNGSGTQTHRYLYGTQVDQVLAEERGTTLTWILADHQGTVRTLINSAGVVQNQISYDSFGNINNQTNPTAAFRFGYTGRDFDTETGQYYYRSRYYDPKVGRFTSEDPIGFEAGDTNLSRYVFNSPTNFTDPSGLITIIIPGGYGETGSLPHNIKSLAQYPVLAVNLGSRFDNQSKKLLSQVFSQLDKGLLPGEPIVIIAHSDGNRLVQRLIDAIRSSKCIVGRSRQRFGIPNLCLDPQKVKIRVVRLDPTGVGKPVRADQVVDVGSNFSRATLINPITIREGASNLFLRPDFRAPEGTSHDGLLYEESIITRLMLPMSEGGYGFRF